MNTSNPFLFALLLSAALVGLFMVTPQEAAAISNRAELHAPAPDFSLPDLQGKEISLSSLQGKAVILTFWATWCGVCREEMPMMDLLYKKYKDKGLEVIGVNVDRKPEPVATVQDFIKQRGFSFPNLLDREWKAMKLYRAHFLPTTFVLDRQGIIVDKKVGSYQWTAPESELAINKLLKKN